MDRAGKLLLAIGMVASLTACASAPSGPYWENQAWNESLFRAIQGSLHYPQGLADQPPVPMKGEVGFTYDQGKLKDVVMVTTTGSATFDTAMVEQVAEAKVPQAGGPDASMPRHYQIELTMPTVLSDFYSKMHVATLEKVFYPRQALMMGQQGAVTVAFDYREGAVSNVQIAQSSGYKLLDDSAAVAVAHTSLPPPTGYESNRLHLQVKICYGTSANIIDQCAGYRYAIQVTNQP